MGLIPDLSRPVPFNCLDRTTTASIGELLLELRQLEQTMLVVVTHSLELSARFKREVELDAGRLQPA